MQTILFHALQTIYTRVPAALVSDGGMILAFALTGIAFYLFFEPERRFSLRAALGHVFRRDLFRHRTSRVDILHFFLAIGFWIPVVGALVTAFLMIDVRDLLAGRFGARTALMHA